MEPVRPAEVQYVQNNLELPLRIDLGPVIDISDPTPRALPMPSEAPVPEEFDIWDLEPEVPRSRLPPLIGQSEICRLINCYWINPY